MDSNAQELKQEIKQRQHQTQMQVQFARMLEQNSEEFDDTVKRALDENPALERVEPEEDEKKIDPVYENIPGYRLNISNRSHEDEMREFIAADDSSSLYDDLNTQIDELTLDPAVAEVARFIIGNLDSNGYLRRPIAGIADDLAIHNPDLEADKDRVEEAFKVVRALDPAGIGAVDLRDCLLLQLGRMQPSEAREDAEIIIRDHFDEFSKRNAHKLVSALNRTPERINNAMELISSLNPKPGSVLGSGVQSKARTIIPDFIIDVDDGDISITVNNRIPDLRISESFAQAVADLNHSAKTRIDNKAKGVRNNSRYVLNRYNDARNFIQMVRNRQKTLYAVMTAIVKFQKQYILSEDLRDLKPMIIKDIEKLTGYDASVISRSTNNKYAETPWGVVPLRSFFSDSLGTEGNSVTSREVQDCIRRIVEQEDRKHPLSDARIHTMLTSMGYPIERRTVSKYRIKLGIPSSRLRKTM